MSALPQNSSAPRIAVYYFPGFHRDPQTDRLHGDEWTEWELVQNARPRFPGHAQPRVPLWGHFDEANPEWGLRQANLAAESGVSAFIFDWYWYQGADFLNRALDEGFLAHGTDLPIDFALMWANHDWLDIHPAGSATSPSVIFPGAVSDAEIDALFDVVVDRYFQHPNYLKVNGAPYFSIYEAETLISGLGSLERARSAILRFRSVAAAHGFPDIHVNLVASDRSVLPGERVSPRIAELVQAFGAASLTSYVWIHHHDPSGDGFPEGSYQKAFAQNLSVWSQLRADSAVPYYPNVTVSWDSSPRALQTDTFRPLGYPWMATMEGTSAELRQALEVGLRFAAQDNRGEQLVTLNAWNEWTEGSYLLPDLLHGDQRLRAVSDAVAEVRQASMSNAFAKDAT